MQKKIELIIKAVSESHNIDYNIVKAVFESQFYCAKSAIKKATPGIPDTFPVIRFRHLGLLTVKPSQILKIHERASLPNTGTENNEDV